MSGRLDDKWAHVIAILRDLAVIAIAAWLWKSPP
jgi:hypothetical protein